MLGKLKRTLTQNLSEQKRTSDVQGNVLFGFMQILAAHIMHMYSCIITVPMLLIYAVTVLLHVLLQTTLRQAT